MLSHIKKGPRYLIIPEELSDLKCLSNQVACQPTHIKLWVKFLKHGLISIITKGNFFFLHRTTVDEIRDIIETIGYTSEYWKSKQQTWNTQVTIFPVLLREFFFYSRQLLQRFTKTLQWQRRKVNKGKGEDRNK